MAERDVIREFLVALGFQVNEDQLRKFSLGILKVSQQVAEVGTATVAAGTAIEEAVKKVAEHFETLYYAARRSGATVQALELLGYAATQAGMSTAEALAAVEALRLRMLTNPGTESFIHTLGVQTRDAAGQLRSTDQILNDLVEHWMKLPFFIAAQQAQLLGIGADELQRLEIGHQAMAEAADDLAARQRAAGVDANDLAEKSLGFMDRVRRLGSELGLVWDQLARLIIPIGDKVLDLTERATEWFASLDAKTHGLSTAILGLVLAFGTWKTAMLGLELVLKLLGITMVSLPFATVLGELALLAAAIYLVYTHWQDVTRLLRDIAVEWGSIFRLLGNIIELLAKRAIRNWTEIFERVGTVMERLWTKAEAWGAGVVDSMRAGIESRWGDFVNWFQDKLKGAFSWLPDWINPFKNAPATGGQPATPAPTRPVPVPGGGATVAPPLLPGEMHVGAAALGVQQNNPGNLRSWGSAPVSRGFAVFKSAYEGLNAMAGNLVAYAKSGLTSIGQIIARWAPPGENNTAAYIADISRALGVGAGAALNLSDPGTLAALMAAMIRHEQGYNPYSAELIQQAANARLGASTGGSVSNDRAVTISQKTDIHVAGGDAGVAKAVANEQVRVNADLVRHTRAAIN